MMDKLKIKSTKLRCHIFGVTRWNQSTTHLFMEVWIVLQCFAAQKYFTTRVNTKQRMSSHRNSVRKDELCRLSYIVNQ